MNPLRITFVLPVADLTGGVRVVAQHAHELVRRGHTVTVVSGSPACGLQRRLSNIKRGRGFGRYFVPPESHIDATKVRHLVLPHNRPVTDADVPDADVVVATWWATAGPVARLRAECGQKMYLIQHDERELCDAGEAVADTWRLALHKVVIAHWLEPRLRAAGATGPIDVVPNTVDTQQFFAPPREKQAVPTVGFMYSGHASKGGDLALEAVRIARESHPGLGLIAFGRDLEYAHMPLPEGTQFTRCPGPEAMRDLYASCDAWLFPSRCEGFGLPILEAMACGTPVIGTPAGAAPDLLPDGGGVLVPHDDAAAMADAVVATVDLPADAWRARSRAAVALARGYSWSDATDKLEVAIRRARSSEKHGSAGAAHAAASPPAPTLPDPEHPAAV